MLQGCGDIWRAHEVAEHVDGNGGRQALCAKQDNGGEAAKEGGVEKLAKDLRQGCVAKGVVKMREAKEQREEQMALGCGNVGQHDSGDAATEHKLLGDGCSDDVSQEEEPLLFHDPEAVVDFFLGHGPRWCCF